MGKISGNTVVVIRTEAITLIFHSFNRFNRSGAIAFKTRDARKVDNDSENDSENENENENDKA